MFWTIVRWNLEEVEEIKDLGVYYDSLLLRSREQKFLGAKVPVTEIRTC